MAQRLLLVALCAVIAVQLISSVEGARKRGCIARCNDGCRNKHAHHYRVVRCRMGCAIHLKYCLKCENGDRKCYGCLPGYSLRKGKCRPEMGSLATCPPGCSCVEPNQCQSCLPGYIMASGVCKACPANCKSCDVAGTTYCDTCMPGYGLSSDHKSCVVCAAHCKSCNIEGKDKCDGNQCGTYTGITGYASKACTGGDCSKVGKSNVGDGSCKVCYSSASSCDVCDVDHFRSVNVNNFASCYKACPIQNCKYCPEQMTCVKCSDTKIGTDCKGTPVACTGTPLPPNCKSCAQGDAVCTDCLLGYKLVGSTCTKCGVENCAVCENSVSECQRCASGYHLYNGGTVCNNACDSYCATADCANVAVSLCDTYCIDGYALDTSVTPIVCSPCSPGCRSCRIEGKGFCDDQQCEDGYTLGADKTCTK